MIAMKIRVWRHFNPKSSCFQVHKQMKIRNLELYPGMRALHTRISQIYIRSTCDGTIFEQNGQKVHKNHKINIFVAKLLGETWGDKLIFQVV